MFATTSRWTRAALFLVAGVSVAAPLTVLPGRASALPALAAAPVAPEAAQFFSVKDLASATLFAWQVGDRPTLERVRSQLAATLGLQMGIDNRRFIAAWVQGGDQRMIAVLSALAELGTPYQHLGAQPGVAFDCSGLTMYAWAQAGVYLPHQSRAQINSIPASDVFHLQPGDILWYPGHVMMSLGVDGAIVHSVNRQKDTELRLLTPERLGQMQIGSPLGPPA
jgi:cell wall-associated NlpC family hydrolase